MDGQDGRRSSRFRHLSISRVYLGTECQYATCSYAELRVRARLTTFDLTAQHGLTAPRFLRSGELILRKKHCSDQERLTSLFMAQRSLACSKSCQPHLIARYEKLTDRDSVERPGATRWAFFTPPKKRLARRCSALLRVTIRNSNTLATPAVFMNFSS